MILQKAGLTGHMRILRCEIELGAFIFDFVTSVEIVSTWEELTDTCTIVIPRKLRYRSPSGKVVDYIVSGTDAVFQRGDPVRITCGYYPAEEYGEIDPYNTIFTGYITSVNPNKPIEIRCEDESFKLKTLRIENYDLEGKPQDLQFLLEDLLDNSESEKKFTFPIVAETMDVGPTTFEMITYAGVLDYLKRTYGLKSYFRDGTLYVGFARVTQNNTENVFNIPNQVIDLYFGRDVVGDSGLSYTNRDDVDISLTAISIDDQNERITATAGATYGERRNLYYYNETQESLQKIAENMVDEFRYNGYRGSFSIFGIPNVNHGDAVTLNNSDIRDQSGTYILEKVVKRFGIEGFRQEIYLGPRIQSDG